MPNRTADETIIKITHSKDVVLTEQEFTSSRRKVFNKYMIAISVVALIVLSTYLFLSATQLTALQAALHKDNYLFYWILCKCSCNIMVAAIISTFPFTCRSFFFMPISSMAALAILEV